MPATTGTLLGKKKLKLEFQPRGPGLTILNGTRDHEGRNKRKALTVLGNIRSRFYNKKEPRG